MLSDGSAASSFPSPVVCCPRISSRKYVFVNVCRLEAFEVGKNRISQSCNLNLFASLMTSKLEAVIGFVEESRHCRIAIAAPV